MAARCTIPQLRALDDRTRLDMASIAARGLLDVGPIIGRRAGTVPLPHRPSKKPPACGRGFLYSVRVLVHDPNPQRSTVKGWQFSVNCEPALHTFLADHLVGGVLPPQHRRSPANWIASDVVPPTTAKGSHTHEEASTLLGSPFGLHRWGDGRGPPAPRSSPHLRAGPGLHLDRLLCRRERRLRLEQLRR